MKKPAYIPALRYDFLTPVYDVFIKYLVPEKKVKKRTIELANLQAHDTLLDFGCGTGTLLKFLKEKYPEIECTGIDNDPRMLNVAKRKLRLFSKTKLVEYGGHPLPFPENNFSVICSTWAFHHLNSKQKKQDLYELQRVLKPNGILIIADWGKPQNALMRFLFFVPQIFDNFETTQANVAGCLPEFMKAASFWNVDIVGNPGNINGTLTHFKAVK